MKYALFALAAFVGLVLLVWFWGIRVPSVPVPQLAGALRQGELPAQSRQRSFRYYLPAERPVPPALLLVFHGSSMTGDRMRRLTGYAFDELADREGFIVVYPDGVGGHWNDCRRVGDYEAKRLEIDDVAFVRELIGWFQREHQIDAERTFAVGLSNGGHMSFRLALEAPGLMRGIAAIAASLPTDDNQECKSNAQPVATLVLNGSEDPLNPYQGGEVALFGFLFRRGTVVSNTDTVRYWVSLAGHAGAPKEDAIPDSDPEDGTSAVRQVWSSEDRPEVVSITVNGGGHTIPHPRASFPRVLGRTSHDFSAAEEIWSFFARQR